MCSLLGLFGEIFCQLKMNDTTENASKQRTSFRISDILGSEMRERTEILTNHGSKEERDKSTCKAENESNSMVLDSIYRNASSCDDRFVERDPIQCGFVPRDLPRWLPFFANTIQCSKEWHHSTGTHHFYLYLTLFIVNIILSLFSLFNPFINEFLSASSLMCKPAMSSCLVHLKAFCKHNFMSELKGNA